MIFADPYIYPGSSVLRNLLGLTDQAALDRLERQHVATRIAEGLPGGRFDLAHLRAIHRHLFQDVYSWAGELRSVEIAKDGHQFMFARFIEAGFADVHRRLEKTDFLRGSTPGDFALEAERILGDVNYVYPFREGNGRTQLLYLEQLAEQAGHQLKLTRLRPDEWIAASRAAHSADYGLMTAAITQALMDD